MESKRRKKEINDQLVCPVCSDNYEISGDMLPRIFMCGHSVCTKCIDVISFNSELICPSCKNQYTIPHGPESVPESSDIINTLKVLEENEEEAGELCKEHERELRYFCKGDHCKIAVCELCMLENHNGHPAEEVVKELQENIQVMLESISKRKSEHTRLCMKGTHCMEGLKKMQSIDFIKFNNMINNIEEKVKLTETLIKHLDRESKNLLEMKNKIIETGKASLEEMKSIQKAMNEGELLGSCSTLSTDGLLIKEECVKKSHEVSAFNLPTSRKVLFMEGLSDGTLAVCFEDYKEGEVDNSKEYFLTQYHSRRFLVIDVKLEEEPSGMKEVSVSGNICLALSFRKQQKIAFRDISKLDEVFLSYSVDPHNPGSLCTESPTTLLFLDESSSPHQLKRLDLSQKEKAITSHYAIVGTGEKRKILFQKPCEYKHLGCPKVLDNHNNYASHVRACSYRITDRPPKVQPCQYKDLGCPKVMSNRGNYRKHIETCPYRITDRPSKVLHKPCVYKHLGCPKVMTGTEYNYFSHVEACLYGKLRKMSKTPCKFVDNGCPRIFNNTKTFMKHVEECPYAMSPSQQGERPCKYKENGCSQILDQINYLRHVRSCPFRFMDELLQKNEASPNKNTFKVVRDAIPCQYANNGCSKVLDNHTNYTRHVNACRYKVNEGSEQVVDRTTCQDMHDGCPKDAEFTKHVKAIPYEGSPREAESPRECTDNGSPRHLGNHNIMETCHLFEDRLPKWDGTSFTNVNKDVLSNIKKEVEACHENDKDVNDWYPETANFSELVQTIPYDGPIQDGNSFGYMGNEFPRVLRHQNYVEICPINDETPEVDKTSSTHVSNKFPEISINYKKHTEVSPENDKEEFPEETENVLCQDVNSGRPKVVDNITKVTAIPFEGSPHEGDRSDKASLTDIRSDFPKVLRNNKKHTEACPEKVNEESPQEAATCQNVSSGCPKVVDNFTKVVKTIPHVEIFPNEYKDTPSEADKTSFKNVSNRLTTVPKNYKKDANACPGNVIEKSLHVADKTRCKDKVVIVLRKNKTHHNGVKNPCKYKDNGCPLAFNDDTYKQHVEMCPYKRGVKRQLSEPESEEKCSTAAPQLTKIPERTMNAHPKEKEDCEATYCVIKLQQSPQTNSKQNDRQEK